LFRESVWKELCQNLLTTRFAACVVLSLMLIIISALVGSQEYRQRLAEYDGLVAGEQKTLEDVRVYSHLKPALARRPNPLIIFNLGYTDRVGNVVKISHRTVPFLASGGGLDNEILSIFPTLDLMDVIIYVLGLLALLISFDAISGEREQGTLRLIMSNSITRGKVALAKYAGGLISLLIPLVMSFLVAILVLNVYFPLGLTGSDWLRILFIIITAVLYLSTMLLVGLCLSSLVRRSSTALMLAMLIWLMFVIVFPNLSDFMASQSIEVETSRSLRQKVESLVDEANKEIALYESHLPKSTVMGELSIYGDDGEVLVRLGRPERYAWLTDYYTYSNQVWLRYADRIWDVRRNHLYQLARQASLATGASHISPAFMADRITQYLAGSSLQDYEDFMEAARNYRGELVNYINDHDGFRSRRWFTDDPPDQEPLVLDPSTFNRNDMDMERAWRMLDAAEKDGSRALDLSDMPRFRFLPAGLQESIRRSETDIFTLMGLSIVLFGLFSLAFSRYDVR